LLPVKADTKSDGSSDANSDASSDTKLDATSNVKTDVKFDGKLDTLGKERQVAFAHYDGAGKMMRRPFEVMRVSVIEDFRNPFYKRLLLVDSIGCHATFDLFGAQAWLCSLSSSNPNDVQPSFAENSIRISCPDSNISWIVANPTAEDQHTFLDRLCFAGCILYDIGVHFTLLPQAAQPSEGKIRLGSIHATARRTTNAEIVALKVASDNERMSQLINEVQFLMNLHHDGIVGAYGIYAVKTEDRKSLGMLLEHKKGGDLSSWIPTGGLPEPMVRGIAAQICDALVYLHAIPAVHRDIKPSNVLCDRAEDGSVKVFLADFGLAAYAMDKKSISRRCGTGGYVAPEVFRRDWTVKSSSHEVIYITKTDVFSFGMLLYKTALGNNPLTAADASLDTKLRSISRSSLSVANMAGHSDELQHLLFGLCAKNPCQRFSISDALAHPWFSSDKGVSDSNDEREYAKVGWDEFEEAARRLRARRFRTRSDEDPPLYQTN